MNEEQVNKEQNSTDGRPEYLRQLELDLARTLLTIHLKEEELEDLKIPPEVLAQAREEVEAERESGDPWSHPELSDFSWTDSIGSDQVKAHLDKLNFKKTMALGLLAWGCHLKEVATTVGVDERTVGRWIHDDVSFRAILNQIRLDMLNSMVTELLNAAPTAARNISAKIAEGDIELSLVLIKGLGGLGGKAPGWRKMLGTPDDKGKRTEPSQWSPDY